MLLRWLWHKLMLLNLCCVALNILTAYGLQPETIHADNAKLQDMAQKVITDSETRQPEVQVNQGTKCLFNLISE